MRTSANARLGRHLASKDARGKDARTQEAYHSDEAYHITVRYGGQMCTGSVHYCTERVVWIKALLRPCCTQGTRVWHAWYGMQLLYTGHARLACMVWYDDSHPCMVWYAVYMAHWMGVIICRDGWPQQCLDGVRQCHRPTAHCSRTFPPWSSVAARCEYGRRRTHGAP